MPILRRRQGTPTRSTATLPLQMREQLREPDLGAVPLDADGSAWAVATAGALVVFNGRSRPETHPWDEVEQGSWDGQERVFTLRWTQQDREDLTLKVPAGVRNGDAYASADVAPSPRPCANGSRPPSSTAPWQRSPVALRPRPACVGAVMASSTPSPGR